MRRILSITLGILLAASPAYAQSKETERLADCARVLQEVLNVPDAIPKDLLDKAECVAVMPSVKKFAIGLGARWGKGAVVCRTGDRMSGPWSPPAMYELGGGSIGFQLGGEAVDFILLVMNPVGAKKLLQSKFTLGADASVAGGPKGRTAEAATDAQLHAEILTYSRTKGLFAGVSLEGSPLRQDGDGNQKLYGKKIEVKKVLFEAAEPLPEAGKGLVDLLTKASPTNVSASAPPAEKK